MVRAASSGTTAAHLANVSREIAESFPVTIDGAGAAADSSSGSELSRSDNRGRPYGGETSFGLLRATDSWTTTKHKFPPREREEVSSAWNFEKLRNELRRRSPTRFPWNFIYIVLMMRRCHLG